MNCPHCNREMKYGSLQKTNTSHMLGLFVPEGDMVSFRGLFSKAQFSANILSGDEVPAWFCERCQKVLAEIDVS